MAGDTTNKIIKQRHIQQGNAEEAVPIAAGLRQSLYQADKLKA